MGQKLYSAVKSDNIEDAQKWLQRGADPNTLGGHLGWTVLVQACSNGSQGMVELLLANGASVNLSSSGETPLAKAAQSRRPEVVELLLQNGAMVNQVDKCGMTALHHAAFSGVATTVKILLEWGGKNDMDDKSGKSPLWYAVESGDEDCVGTLLDYKANPNDKSKYHGSPKDIAKRKNRNDLVAMLDEATNAIEKPKQDFLRVPPASTPDIRRYALYLGLPNQQIYRTSATAKIPEVSGPKRPIPPGGKPTILITGVSDHYKTPRSGNTMANNAGRHKPFEKEEPFGPRRQVPPEDTIQQHDKDKEIKPATGETQTEIEEDEDEYVLPCMPPRPIAAQESSKGVYYKVPRPAARSSENPRSFTASGEDQLMQAQLHGPQKSQISLTESDRGGKRSGNNNGGEYSNAIELSTKEPNIATTKRFAPKPVPRKKQRAKTLPVSTMPNHRTSHDGDRKGNKTPPETAKIFLEQSSEVLIESKVKQGEVESTDFTQQLKRVRSASASDNGSKKAAATLGDKPKVAASKMHLSMEVNESKDSDLLEKLTDEERDSVIRKLEGEEETLAVQFQSQKIEDTDQVIEKDDGLPQSKKEFILEKEAVLRAQASEIANYKMKIMQLENLLSHSEEANAKTRQRLQQYENALSIPSNHIRMTGIRLGQGSYGEVRVGYWQGCSVAVKMLYDVLAASPYNVDRLQQEVASTWKVHHPNIASVYGVTLEIEGKKEDRKAWIIMELLQGSLSGVIKESKRREGKPLTLREKVDVAHDCLCGLNYLHSMPHAVVHGDIRPTNILVTEAMKAKLGDLGTSRFCSASLTVGLVSPQYSAMERMDGRVAKNTVETDLYSMGVTMCELFTGLPPNRSDRLDQVQVIRHRDFRYLCMQMVSDDISRRPSAAGALSTISRIRETEDYKACRPRRLVKGKADGAEDVTLIDLM